jgi:asparagine synthase (glutamine-hydrolysing)
MCGIAVILPGSDLSVSPFAIDRMTAALHHRGPDAQQVLRLPHCHLGHTRLSIIDPANGRQPMTDPTGRYSIVFNGEIYNHRDLRRDLEREGFAFRTNCDTEALLLGYARWGRNVLPRLNGQFAFAVWDSVERTLFTARDRFGEKPLYFATTPHGDVLLASEIKSILAAGLLRPRIDTLSADAYLGLFYVPPDRTIYTNVHALPPAHAAVFRAGAKTEQWRYWEPRYSVHDGIDEPDAVAHVRALLERAVARQTVADVPVGAFLSGGLDSTTIVGLMSAGRAEPVKTFSVGFADLIDELPFARDVAKAYGTDHHELQMNIDVAAMLDRMTAVYDEPFGDSSNIPTFLVSEYARRTVKVVLSGDGGDEIFGGYDWYRNLLRGADGGDPWERHVGGATHALFDRSDLWGRRPAPDTPGALRESHPAPPGARGMDAATAFDVSCYLPGDILAKVDRAAMAHGLETRSPFLDVELAEFVLGLPCDLRFATPSPGIPGEGRGEGSFQSSICNPQSAIATTLTPTLSRSTGRGGNGVECVLKHLLRAACGDLWPDKVRSRGKQGFGAPVRYWLQQPQVNAMWDRVTRADSPLYFLLPGLATVIPDLRPQRKWTLLCLGLWLERNDACLAGLS